MTYSLKERSLYNREDSIKGSWLYDLAKKYRPNDTDEYIKLIGLDNSKRIEIEVSVHLFNQLKTDPVFVMKAENLRRLRTSKYEGSKFDNILLEYLVFPISDFDNDLDKVQNEQYATSG